MKCYNHNHMDAVATCSCGKTLCHNCADKYGSPVCDSCAHTYLEDIKKDQKSYYIKCYIISAILFVWLGSANGSILAGLPFACAPWGWSVLNKITPNIFLSMSWIGWIAYFIIKLALSTIIGVFIAPFQIYKSIKVFTSK